MSSNITTYIYTRTTVRENRKNKEAAGGYTGYRSERNEVGVYREERNDYNIHKERGGVALKYECAIGANTY